VVLLGVTVLSVAHFFTFPFRQQPLTTDVRNFVYYASRVSAGELPHRDFFENRTPLASFVGGGVHAVSRAAGWDPLLGIRAAYLLLAALGGSLSFVVHRRLSGKVVGGVLGLAAYLAFPLIGGLPCIGNVPKLLVALLGNAVALLARRGWWLGAGAAGGLAFLDWQIGALVVLAAAVSAVAAGRPHRGRRLAKIAAGLAVTSLPVLLVYGGAGALAPLGDQAILSVWSRAAEPATVGLWNDLPRRYDLFTRGVDGRLWMAALAGPGLFLFLRRLIHQGEGPGRALVVSLAVYHYGIAAFSILDFQGYGDVFILLHSVAFFAAVSLNWADRRLRTGLEVIGRPRLAVVAALVVAIVVARPWVAGRRFHLVLDPAAGALTLDDQRRLALQLRGVLDQPAVGVIGPAELRFLSGTANPFPLVFWNRAAHRYFRSSAHEPEALTLRRLARASHLRFAICDRDGPGGVCASAFGPAVPWSPTGAGGTVRLFAVSP
jgi:hypothetical protein